MKVEEESLLQAKEIELISGRKGKMEPTNSHPPIISSRSLSLAVEEMELAEKVPPSPGQGRHLYPCSSHQRNSKDLEI